MKDVGARRAERVFNTPLQVLFLSGKKRGQEKGANVNAVNGMWMGGSAGVAML